MAFSRQLCGVAAVEVAAVQIAGAEVSQCWTNIDSTGRPASPSDFLRGLPVRGFSLVFVVQGSGSVKTTDLTEDVEGWVRQVLT